jgi:predicted Zn-dependent protease with MMP-like domain
LSKPENKANHFERLVEEILDELPEEFADKVANVEFVVEDRCDSKTKEKMKIRSGVLLMGLYQGVPLKHRSPTWYAGVLPDRIVIYRENIEAVSRGPAQLREVLQRTIYHEIAHYFGISDQRLRELGVY